MIGVAASPASSRAARMAATRPSIMSDGATISAPPRAWEAAVRAGSGSAGAAGRGARGGGAGPLDDAVVVVGLGAGVVLGGGQAEQEDGGDAQRPQLPGLGGQHVERELVLAGHRLDLAPNVLAVGDEQRVDEPLRREAGRGARGR